MMTAPLHARHTSGRAPRGRIEATSLALIGVIVSIYCTALAVPTPLEAQVRDPIEQVPPNRGGFTTSMGLPSTWKWSLGGTAGVHRRDGSDVALYFHGGVYKDLLSPVMAAFGLLTEGYVGRRGTFEGAGGFDGGFRLQGYSPALRFAAGLDYNFADEEGDFILSLIHPLQRGGIFTNGGALRIDYLPGRNHSTGIGVQLPIGQKWVGRTRPRHDKVPLRMAEPPVIEFVPSDELTESVADLDELGHWINRLTVPFTDQWDGNKDEALQMFVAEMTAVQTYLGGTSESYAGSNDPIADVEAFHDELERAFTFATGGRVTQGRPSPLGTRVATRAREIVLDEVLFPYNRLLGRKRDADTTTGLGAQASMAFYQWLTEETPVPEERLRATAWVFARYLDVIEETRRRNRELWLDARFVWIPFQLALRAEQHDEQAELNSLVERATGVDFVKASPVWYVENEQWQSELSRMILEAEDYHIIWVHDFRGYDANGDPDEMAFKQVTESYFPALINAVNRYDQTGKIPQYIQIFDQFYFHANGGPLWANLLQDPMRHAIDLPRGWEMWEDSIAGLQQELRDAVEGSRLLQSQALQAPEDWLYNVVKVHVNITQPADPSFWTNELFPFWMGLADTPMRDHRKIALYDASEVDPYRGGAIYTGMGVGEHYIGAGWEDRALMVEGPVVLQLRNSARQILLNQGFAEHEIPFELQPKPYADDYDERIEAYLERNGDWGGVLETHNQIGYRPKGVTAFKATLYTLMPPGSVIKAPDSIWGSNLWGSMMLGHALRGGRSLVIAPAIANAPSAGSPQMSRAQEAMTRLVVADQMLGDVIEERGGLMKVGLYSTELEVRDIPGRMGALLETLESTPWLRELYSFDPAVLRGVDELRQSLIRDGYTVDYSVDQERVTAKLHLKAHLYMSREAWDGILRLPGWESIMRVYYEELAANNLALANDDVSDRDMRELSNRLDPAAVAVLEPYIRGLSASEWSRHAMFLSVGSTNQNTRSLALDGEVALVTSNVKSMSGLMDFITIAALCTWIDDLETLEELFPGYDGMARRISRFIRMSV